jgi:hypothetical protein
MARLASPASLVQAVSNGGCSRTACLNDQTADVHVCLRHYQTALAITRQPAGCICSCSKLLLTCTSSASSGYSTWSAFTKMLSSVMHMLLCCACCSVRWRPLRPLCSNRQMHVLCNSVGSFLQGRQRVQLSCKPECCPAGQWSRLF